jgi:23S rRNA (pseudouridine1915-N3)-methyltransferase
MKINIVAAGKIKEEYFARMIDEYSKRIGRFCAFNIKETPDVFVTKEPNDSEVRLMLAKEAAHMLPHLKGYVVVCDAGGELYSSDELARLFKNSNTESEFTFVVGGSHGLSEQIKKEARILLSFGRFTYPHKLLRVMLAEQIYRALTINNNMPYHK